MYRPRRTGDLRRSFTFGGRVPSAVGLVLVLILVATVGSWIVRNGGWAVLSPGLVFAGQIWRLATWPFVQDDPLTLLFGGFMLYQFGSQLAFDWGEGRFLRTFAGLTIGAGLLTCALAVFLPPVRAVAHVGMWPVVTALLLMWALRNPDQQLNFWGVLPMTGRTVALLVVAGTVLYGLAAGGIYGLFRFTTHFSALFLGWMLTRTHRGVPLRRWKLAWRDFKLERQLRRRSKHLKVVRKNGQDEKPRWMN